MITPADCRKLNPDLESKTDEELQEVIELLYGLGELALESYFDGSKNLRGVSRLNNNDMPK